MSSDLALPPAKPFRFRAAPDGLIAAVLLSFLATAGLFYVNILPALVDGLKTGLHFTARDAGFVASANVYGAALGAFTAVFTVKALPWRPVALVVLIALIAIDLASTQILTPHALIAVRFVHGSFGGFLVGTAYAIFARTKTPDRVFGMLLAIQFTLGGVGLMFLPRLVPIYGAPVLFLALAGFSLVTLAMLPFLDAYERPAQPAVVIKAKAQWLPLAVVLFAVFIYQCGNEGLGAYVLGLGRSNGLGTDAVSGALGVAGWIGALGSVVVVLIGLKYGRATPLMVGMVVSFAANLLFFLKTPAWAYGLANILGSMAWSFTIAYLLGLGAAFDRGGRSAALAGFCSKMGLATGPAIGGLLLEETHYPRLIIFALVGISLSAIASAWPAFRLDRQKTP